MPNFEALLAAGPVEVFAELKALSGGGLHAPLRPATPASARAGCCFWAGEFRNALKGGYSFFPIVNLDERTPKAEPASVGKYFAIRLENKKKKTPGRVEISTLKSHPNRAVGPWPHFWENISARLRIQACEACEVELLVQ